MIVRRKDLQSAASRTYYLDLARLARLQDERNTPFTPAVHAYYALVEALREYEEQGGRAARYDRYAALAERVRAGLAALGIGAAIPAERILGGLARLQTACGMCRTPDCTMH